jgi:hypothetical protein
MARLTRARARARGRIVRIRERSAAREHTGALDRGRSHPRRRRPARDDVAAFVRPCRPDTATGDDRFAERSCAALHAAFPHSRLNTGHRRTTGAHLIADDSAGDSGPDARVDGHADAATHDAAADAIARRVVAAHTGRHRDAGADGDTDADGHTDAAANRHARHRVRSDG